MFHAIGRIVTKRPRAVIIVMVLFMLFAGALGGGVVKKLTGGGFEDKTSESVIAAKRLSQDFGQKSSNMLLLVTPKNTTVDDATATKNGLEIEQKLRESPNVTGVFSYWTAGRAASLKSKDSTQAMIIATVQGNEDEVTTRIKELTPTFTIDTQDQKVGVGGFAEINHQFSAQIEKDLKFAEMIALPVTLIILLLVFRSVVAALLPLLVGVFSIFGSLLVMFILTKFTSVSIYALNLTTMMGLGLAIDYSLFIVSRFREQLAKGDKVELAVKRTVISAGRTVLFSAFTVAVSLAALMVFKQPFLRSFAFAGVAVSIVASIGSLLLLPAILMLLGERINAWPVGKKVSYEKGSKFWHRVALIVMDRPIVVALSVIAVLFVLGQPFFSINLGRGDERSLPKTNPVRIVHEDIRKNFSSRETSALQVVTATNANVNEKTITDYAAELSKVQGVDHVESSYGVYASGLKVSPLAAKNQLVPEQGTYFSVVPNVEPFSKDGEKLTKALRALPAPFKVYVGGSSADLTDLKASIFSRLPWAILMISITTFILLFMMFGGLLVPIKALVINFMSLSATFGAMVWIFQQGHLSGLLNFTATGMIDATMPILMFCVAFGLSMDYEVFLLSRIKEHHDKHGNNRDAVAHGLEKTGGIVTAAALSISVVFLAFATSGVTLIKLFGLGLALAVLLDAFVIRGTLVPAFMRLAGDANWWAPKPLAKFYKRFGITEID